MSLRVFAADCVTRFETDRTLPAGTHHDASSSDGPDDPEPSADSDTTDHPTADARIHRGRVVVVVKPDDTVLVHDAAGYQPVAWLTRPESLSVAAGGDGFSIVASDGRERLRVASVGDDHRASFPMSRAGRPVGDCSRCDGQLIATAGAVLCLGCGDEYPLPTGADVLDRSCDDCGLPRMRVERGGTFRLCVDRECESLYDAVADALDGAVDCPDCGRELQVRTHRGRQFLGCAGYPDCETAFSIPAGEHAGTCACGLPRFDTGSGPRCLDGSCDLDRPAEDAPDHGEGTGP